MRRFFQIRYNNKPMDQRLYATLNEASGVLVRKHDLNGEVVELDHPAGAVVRRFPFAECESMVSKTQTS